MVSPNSANNLLFVIFAFTLAFSTLFIAMTTGMTQTELIRMLIIFIVPLVLAFVFSICGVFGNSKMFLMFGWFLTVYQTVFDIDMFFLFIASGLTVLVGEPSLLLLKMLLVFILPLGIAGIGIGYFVKVYSEHLLRKNYVYLFSYLVGIVVLVLQLSAVYLLG